MPIEVAELADRWSRLQDLLDRRGLDAAVVRGTGQSPEMMYLTGAWVQAADAYFLLSRDGGRELVVRGGTSSAASDQFLGDELAVVREQPGVSPLPGRVVEWLAGSGAEQIGINDQPGAAVPWVTALAGSRPNLAAHSLSSDLQALRFVKSTAELDILRYSAQLADYVWDNVNDFVGVGRSPREIVGAIQHYLVREGCDVPIAAYYGSLVVVLKPNPPLNWFSLSEPLRRGDYFSLEVSPRIEGYYSQLTGVISIGPADDELVRSHNAIAKARRASLDHVRVGHDATTAAKAMTEVLNDDGYGSSDGNIGHLLGLDITEPRVGKESFGFQAGMTLVAHPMLRSADIQQLLSGETYLVTDVGPERLNTTSFDAVREL